MSEFLGAIKADLSDRRLLPIVALVGVALLAAIAYAVLGGGVSSSGTPTASTIAPGAAGTSRGITVSQVSDEKAIAETTSGISRQRHGFAHNPFTLLPAVLKAEEATASKASAGSAGVTPQGTGSSSTSTPSSSAGSSGSSSEPSTPKSEPKQQAPAQPKPVYHVAVLFGLVPTPAPGETAPAAQLTPYENLKLDAPLPSPAQPLVVYRGVTAGGKSVTFTLLGEAILHGPGVCKPSPEQCQAVDLKAGQTEKLETLLANGETALYELQVVTIVANAATTAANESLLAPSKAGGALLRKDGLLALPGLHFSAQAGVLVFAPRQRPGGHARSAHHRG